eukprot:Opistho-1_new@87970
MDPLCPPARPAARSQGEQRTHHGAGQGPAQMRQRRDGDVPSRHLAQRRAQRLLQHELEGEAGRDQGAYAAFAPRALQQRDHCHRHARMQDAGQPTEVQQLGLQQQAQLGQRPAQGPGQRRGAWQPRGPAQPCQHRAAGQIGTQMQAAPVHEGRRPGTPGLLGEQRRLRGAG